MAKCNCCLGDKQVKDDGHLLQSSGILSFHLMAYFLSAAILLSVSEFNFDNDEPRSLYFRRRLKRANFAANNAHPQQVASGDWYISQLLGYNHVAIHLTAFVHFKSHD